jgi:hypothetical protein
VPRPVQRSAAAGVAARTRKSCITTEIGAMAYPRAHDAPARRVCSRHVLPMCTGGGGDNQIANM